jgi:TolA-binding protein
MNRILRFCLVLAVAVGWITVAAPAAQADPKLEAELKEAAAQIQQLREVAAKLEAALAASHQQIAALRDETAQLRKQLAVLQQDRDEQVQRAVALTDQLAEAQSGIQRLKGGDATTAPPNVPPTPEAPSVEGMVLAVGEKGLIEISIGSDDGIEEGARLDAYRLGEDSGVYLGKVEVVETNADKAVCKILPEFQKDAIRRGDRVTTRL